MHTRNNMWIRKNNAPVLGLGSQNQVRIPYASRQWTSQSASVRLRFYILVDLFTKPESDKLIIRNPYLVLIAQPEYRSDPRLILSLGKLRSWDEHRVRYFRPLSYHCPARGEFKTPTRSDYQLSCFISAGRAGLELDELYTLVRWPARALGWITPSVLSYGAIIHFSGKLVHTWYHTSSSVCPMYRYILCRLVEGEWVLTKQPNMAPRKHLIHTSNLSFAMEYSPTALLFYNVFYMYVCIFTLKAQLVENIKVWHTMDLLNIINALVFNLGMVGYLQCRLANNIT